MEKIDFNAEDGVKLNGLLYKSNTKTNKIIISVHGMSSNCFREKDDIISKKANENKIDYFCFNNRGAELVKYLVKSKGKTLGGTSYEDVLESDNDIIGAIRKMQEMGYTEIYLQGHSLGCTKVVYTYTKLLQQNNTEILKNIKSLILLSLIDIPTALKYFLKGKVEKYIKLAEEKVEQHKELELMPKESCIHPISAKTFLRYTKDYKEIDFINTQTDEKLETLNNIEIPIFMRWGNVNEMIIEEATQYSNKIRQLIKNEKADIGYIDGADHSYHGKEEILAEQIIEFLTKS